MILVTGGTGFLGSHLLYRLAKTGSPIKAIYRKKEKLQYVRKIFDIYDSDNAFALFEKINWVHADVLDLPSLEPHFNNVTQIYHLAGMVSYDKKDFPRMMKVNREGTANMVNFALKYKVAKFCFVSSTAAVSFNSEDRKAPLIEANRWSQSSTTSGYAISKYSAEKEVWRGIEEGLSAFIINPCIILGAGNWNDSSLTILKLADRGFPFYAMGINAIVDVRDVVECMYRGMNENLPSDRYLCTGESISFRTLMNLLADKLYRPRPRWKAGWLITKVALILDASKGILGYKRTLTQESIKTSQSVTYYDSSKLKNILDIQFHSVEETIDFAVKNRIK